MDARSRADELREASNPLFNDRKLKLGTFCSNLSGGATMSSIDGILQAKWDSALALARMADEMEFEAIVRSGAGRASAAPPISTAKASNASPLPPP